MPKVDAVTRLRFTSVDALHRPEGKAMSLGKDFERQMTKANTEHLKEASREAQRKLDRAHQRLKRRPPDDVRRGHQLDLEGTS